jgi:lycopene beta-cyclase
MPDSKKPDYIILGAGCAGLSLVMRMIRSGKFSDKHILLIDKTPKISNDRTWCFWEKGKGFFDEIVYKTWSSLNFFSQQFSSTLNIAPYQYKMIRGTDFYTYCFDEMKRQKNIEIIYKEVKDIGYQNSKSVINLNNGSIEIAETVVFNSIYKPSRESNNRSIRLLQHFKGWVIETEKPFFNPGTVTLMDFRVKQDNGTTFTYTLPFSETEALIEYTLFSDQLLGKDQYDKALKEYIGDILKIEKYRISDQEFGVIPMTNERFQFYKNGVYYIGTAGGQTKASSGYTFQFIQKQSEQIVDYLISGKSLQSMPASPQRFRFYDTVLLRLLAERKLGGDEIFSRLFQRNNASRIFRFLDNETSLKEDLKLISTLPVLPFLKAAMR